MKMNPVVAAFCFFLGIVSLTKSDKAFISSIGDIRNHPSSFLSRIKVVMQPKELIDECTDCQPIPTPADLDVYRLTRFVGGALDNNLVSVSKPKDFDSTRRISLYTDRQNLKMLVLNITQDIKISGGTITKEQENFLVSWLQKLSSCPLRQIWRDMGLFSWPRYLRRAYCGAKRCSTVPSMQCIPSSSRRFPVLRWYCTNSPYHGYHSYSRRVRQRVVKRKGFYCRWIKYNHPITTGCTCGCQS